jgi:3-dehydroquinate synthase II/3-amino-4-hydroxybenzoic acid synthase
MDDFVSPDRTIAKISEGLRRSAALPPGLWFDTEDDAGGMDPAVLGRVLETEYTGIILYPERLDFFADQRFQRLTRILHVDSLEVWNEIASRGALDRIVATQQHWVMTSADQAVLANAARAGLKTGLREFISDSSDMDRVIATGGHHHYVILRFKDPTNIPLELVIAELQSTHTAVIKEIGGPGALDDISATLGTMEVGADGIVCSPKSLDQLNLVLTALHQHQRTTMNLQPATVKSSRPIGMGQRACVDLVTLFEPTEGILVGSTSHGGILCCAEVFHLPYMEQRPFRVNAGGIHSYIFGVDNRTRYLSELRAGSPCLIVGTTGDTRSAAIGRIKIETRPLRLISCEFESGEAIGVVMQNDWHVRVFGADGEARNITELRPGDKVLAHRSCPGRHVGIQISEFILER